MTSTMDPGSSGNYRLIFTYTYQIVDGVKLPEHVAVIRESHYEVWRYRLSDCIVRTSTGNANFSPKPGP